MSGFALAMEFHSIQNHGEELNRYRGNRCVEFASCLWLVFLVTLMTVAGCSRATPSHDESNRKKDNGTRIVNGNADPIFEVVGKESGFEFRHTLAKQGQYFFPDIMVAGCGVLDFDRDGLLDLLLIDSGDFGSFVKDGSSKADLGQNRLFRQISPGKFEDVTEQVGLNFREYGSGVAIADINNDGFDDLFFSNYGDDRLYLNENGKSFRDITPQSGIRNQLWATSATFLDFDGDGRLDLYVTNYVSYLLGTNCNSAGDKEDFCSPQVFGPTVDKLFRNVSKDGAVKFEDVSAAMGISKKKGPGLGVIARDFNQDGFVDIYVANDGQSNFLWINQEGKSFEDKATQLGCAFGIKGETQAGMGVSVADLDANGVQDIVVTHLDEETNAAYLGNIVETRNGKQLYFTESGGETGVQAISRAMTGFGVLTPDLDNDGDQDILTANGRVRRRQRDPTTNFWEAYAERNQISINQGNGKFKELEVDDPFRNHTGVSRGLSLLDLDNDGKLDCLVTNADDSAFLYRNRIRKSGNWVGIQTVIPELGGRNALGAIVKLEAESGKSWTRTIQSDGSYLSASDPRAHFGLGDQKSITRAVVIWPDRSTEQFSIDEINRYHVLQKGTGNSID